MIELNYVSVIFCLVYVVQTVVAIGMEGLNVRANRRRGNRAPDGFEEYIDEAELKRISSYTADNSRAGIIEKLVNDALVFGLIMFGFFGIAEAAAWPGVAGYAIGGAVFFVGLSVLFVLIDLPFNYYQTFVIEERYGFNRSTVKTWAADQAKSFAVSTLLLLIVAVPVLLLFRWLPHYWWLWAFAVMAVIQLGLTVLYPIVIAPLFNTFEPLKDEALAKKVEDLIRSTGMKAGGICQMDAGRRSSHSNAYFTGLGNTKRVVLFDTLLEAHTHDEILAVLAHELGHYKRRHILKGFLLSQVMSFTGLFLTAQLLQWDMLYSTFGIAESRPYAAFFTVAVFWRKVGYFVQPLLMAYSRKNEREADRFAAELMGSGEALALAFKKLAAHNLANLVPHPLYVWLYYSHPPIPERVSALSGSRGV
jgi:STE24 endopeptidase